MPDELLLLHVDSMLMERAAGQIIDNAAKYSPAKSLIAVQGEREGEYFVLTVRDQGAGLDAVERSLLGVKFFRGARAAQSTSGLGLGFLDRQCFRCGQPRDH
jgi:K+-sensing histidine kinase KdpD